MIREIPEKPDYVVMVTKLRGTDSLETKLLVEIVDTDSPTLEALSTYELSFDGHEATTDDPLKGDVVRCLELQEDQSDSSQTHFVMLTNS